MKLAQTSVRGAWVALLVLLLAIRSLAPAGFMPAFERGSVTIVACPGAGGIGVSMGAHRHGEHERFHQQCPYASASALGGLANAGPPVLAALVLAAGLLLPGRAFLFIDPCRARERPPLRGPPNRA